MLSLTARGNLALPQAAILTALAEHETDVKSENPNGAGAAHAARWVDPRRNGRGGDGRGGGRGAGSGGSGLPRLNHPDRAWVAADGACKLCELLGKPTGNHWHDDCPHKAAGLAARQAARQAEQAAAARAAGKAAKAAEKKEKEAAAAASMRVWCSYADWVRGLRPLAPSEIAQTCDITDFGHDPTDLQRGA
jgi:hypothetical protein